jgi:hypothetical protein
VSAGKPTIALLALPAALFVVVVFALPMAGLGRMSFNAPWCPPSRSISGGR